MQCACRTGGCKAWSGGALASTPQPARAASAASRYSAGLMRSRRCRAAGSKGTRLAPRQQTQTGPPMPRGLAQPQTGSMRLHSLAPNALPAACSLAPRLRPAGLGSSASLPVVQERQAVGAGGRRCRSQLTDAMPVRIPFLHYEGRRMLVAGNKWRECNGLPCHTHKVQRAAGASAATVGRPAPHLIAIP